MLKSYKALELWMWSPEVSFKDKTLQRICFNKEFYTFLHFLHRKFTLRKYLKDFSELVLTYRRPSKKCKDFMRTFSKHFDPISVLRLSSCGFTTARRGMTAAGKNYWGALVTPP